MGIYIFYQNLTALYKFRVIVFKTSQSFKSHNGVRLVSDTELKLHLEMNSISYA